MKIALLADVHANLSALEAVIAHARTVGVDEFWNLGDSVGYAPFPNETVLLLQKTCSQNIVGNYDAKVLSYDKRSQVNGRRKDPDKRFSFEWTAQVLDAAARTALLGWPPTVRVDVEGRRMLLVHASPHKEEEGITVRTRQDRLGALSEKADADVVLCAHTHRALERKVGSTLWLNPGSVGRSFDGDPRASYMVCEVTRSRVKTQLFRVPYENAALAAEMRTQNFPTRLIRSVQEARSLDDLDGFSVVTADQILGAVVACGRECRYEKEHAHQVARLALKLFDGLECLHGLGLRERLWLQSAALLHDVGLVYGVDAHHKSSRDIILKADKIPFTERERTIVALVARYHRKGLPEAGHKYYKDLTSYDQEIVDVLAGMLRVADGLDRGHQSLVKDVDLKILPAEIQILLEADAPVLKESSTAVAKSDLLEAVCSRRLVIKSAVHPPSTCSGF